MPKDFAPKQSAYAPPRANADKQEDTGIFRPAAGQHSPFFVKVTGSVGRSAGHSGGVPTLQRMSVKIKGNDTDGVVTVSVEHRASTGYAQGQGSHNTAWVSFVDMVKLRVEKKPHKDAAESLEACYNELLNYLPGNNIKNQNYKYYRELAKIAVAAAVKNPTNANLEEAISGLLEMRNHMPLSRTDDGKKTVGNEWVHTYLMEMERMCRDEGKDVKKHKYYDQRAYMIWELFDYQPTTSVDNGEIVSTIMQHIMSMQATYEELYARHLKKAMLIDYFIDHKWDSFTERMKNTTTKYPDIDQKKSDIKDTLKAKK